MTSTADEPAFSNGFPTPALSDGVSNTVSNAGLQRGKWKGGRFYDTADGRVHLIERRVEGQLKCISLAAGLSEKHAEAELALFLRDRASYLQEREGRVQEHLVFKTHLQTYLATLDDGSPKHRSDTEKYLEKWNERLGRKNIRRLTVSEIRDQLPVKVARKKWIASIKAYLGWLHSEDKLTGNPAETIKVPPARRSEKRKGYEISFIQKTYAAIEPKPRSVPVEVGGRPVDEQTAQSVRDVFAIAAFHGMHFSEIERLVNEGEIVALDPKPHESIGGYAVFRHKNGDEHRQALTPQTIAAAQRLQARKSVPVESCVREHLERAAKAMQLDPKKRLRLSQLRHSFFTNGLENGTQVIVPAGLGATMAELAASAGHKQLATSFKHYTFKQVPNLVLLPYRLVHASDPALS
jgi:hypothetical protein